MKLFYLFIVAFAMTSLILSSSINDGLYVFGQKEKYRAKLSPKYEIPRINSTAGGSANFKSKNNILTWKLNITGLSNATGAKIFLGNKTEKGEPIVDLIKSNSWSRTPLGIRMNGSISASDLQGPLQGKSVEALKSVMTNRSAYVNILTESHPDGEIRGQIKMMAPKANQTSVTNKTTVTANVSNHTISELN
jgi:hypothetical protein